VVARERSVEIALSVSTSDFEAIGSFVDVGSLETSVVVAREPFSMGLVVAEG